MTQEVTFDMEYPEMNNRREPNYDVICNDRVIASFKSDGSWSMVKGAILQLDSEEHGCAFFQVERVVYAWSHPPGVWIDGLPPDRPENEGQLYVRPYVRELQVGIGHGIV